MEAKMESFLRIFLFSLFFVLPVGLACGQGGDGEDKSNSFDVTECKEFDWYAWENSYPVHYYAKTGNLKNIVICVMFPEFYDIDKKDNFGLTPLAHAVVNDQWSIVECLLENGARVRDALIEHLVKLHQNKVQSMVTCCIKTSNYDVIKRFINFYSKEKVESILKQIVVDEKERNFIKKLAGLNEAFKKQN